MVSVSSRFIIFSLQDAWFWFSSLLEVDMGFFSTCCPQAVLKAKEGDREMGAFWKNDALT
ncbi:hypothetical protein M758_9G137300 [Ceratodon purpureus]|uniref:Uncharacterized protein n=1 Tax=Ceratodon purpureus TaxID=3225 RepID=A0A8T0GVI5_CERPU|nr:hypothetical protein KC19_9G084900 [Ceratodon purpureus]KAG0606389.1 hypothetical protein M758_9G137300 [Ceratodon purpureus]